MEVITLGQNYTKPVVMCLGFFDCMHLGHVELLSVAKKIAASNAQVALFTFSNNHFETLKRPTKLIYTFRERLALYQSLGVDVVVAAQFDEQFMSATGNEFLSQIAKFNLVGVVCGADYTCGSDLTTATSVKEFFNKIAPVQIVQLVKRDEQKVCSSLVRQLLTECHVKSANQLLSEPFFFLGEVTHGRSIGHSLGFPTVNLQIPAEKIVPLGVYGGVCQFEGNTHKAIVNVGAQPTFGCGGNVLEAHLLNFDGNLYGKTIKIALTKYLRPIIKFENATELLSQLQRDLEAVQND